MIFDGYWKKELKYHIKQIRLWQYLSANHSKYAEHQINKYVLYSAIVIRKMIEEEKDAEKQFKASTLKMPVLYLLNYKVPVLRFKFSGDDSFILHRIITDYYKDKAVKDTLEPEYVGNNIIHSYIWGLGYSDVKDKRRITHFMVSSDKFKSKYLYSISLNDWIAYVEYCINKSTI